LNWVDPFVLLWVALSALVGYQRGLTAQALSLVGLGLGALAGSRLAPLLLPEGSRSPWVPLASLIGAVLGALVLQAGAVFLGNRVRGLFLHGPFRLADSAGGLIVGAVVGLAVAWLAAVAALQIQGSALRSSVQDSVILSELVDAVPPRAVLRTLARIDPLPLLAAPPDLKLPKPDGSVLRSPVAREAGKSVVKVLSTACGTGVQGSGWLAGPGLVVTNAHVVAGSEETRVASPGGRVVAATLVYVDRANDVALLRARGLRLPALELADAQPAEEEVVLLGYPHDGPLTATAGTAGRPEKVLAPGADGEKLRLRTVVPLSGSVERGDSGGPVIDADGDVVAMMFASSKEGGAGFGVPTGEMREALRSPRDAPVSPGPCQG
jgi:S1-C subfamily serine protease